MLTFTELGLSPNLLKGIEDLEFKKPTPIQEKIIPIIFSSENDIIGLAQTGTGKTAAYGLPIIQNIDFEDNSVQALILSPTRELCMQIAGDMVKYSKHIKGFEVVAVYGGASIENQIRALKKGAHVIVATPGRMLDLIKRRAAKIDKIRTVVLDEADEMLNMGFREDLDSILETTPKAKRTFLFSATMPEEVARISKNYMQNATTVTIGTQNSGAENVKHIYYQVHARNRYLVLKRIADYNPDIYGIVFCRTRMETKEVADKLIKDGYNADALHGDLSQSQRDHVMKRFRERTLQMLVATDVAARGIDVSDISHVINYNLPDDLDVYTHRSGRTGRADKSGISISIVNYREKSKIPSIEKAIKKKMERQPVPNGNEICQRQLFKMIDKMEKVEVDELQIAPFMDVVNKKLEWLSKEDVIKHFVSLEFNRFLEYYKNAPDLNEKDSDKYDDGGGRGRSDRGDRRSRSDRGGRSERNDRGERGERGERSGRENRSDSYNRSDRGERTDRGDRQDRGERTERRRPEKGGYVRFFINVGKKDKLLPKNIIGLVNDYAKDRDINIGEIDMKDSFSFFEVGEKHAEKVLSSFKDGNYKGRKIVVEQAEAVGSSKKKKVRTKRGK
ncbi:MAG: DEAD/DEAH box helicase [Bacteroidales bacterium]|nr:DEAD/DEAH box helicase [Bacteroidales bacterium]